MVGGDKDDDGNDDGDDDDDRGSVAVNRANILCAHVYTNKS